jgi:hypothetical protein
MPSPEKHHLGLLDILILLVARCIWFLNLDKSRIILISKMAICIQACSC